MTMISKRMLLAALCLVSFGGLGSATAAAQGQPPVEGSQRLRAKAAQNGRISIIAQLGGMPEGIAASAVEGARRNLRQRLAVAGVPEIRALGTLPFVDMEVGARQLASLVASGLVTAIGENRVDKVTLNPTTPLVGGAADWTLG